MTETSAYWKTVTIGIHKNLIKVRQALKASGSRIADSTVDDILNKVPLAKEPVKLNLVVKTTKELTEKDIATTKEVFKSAARLGLQKCPAEVGPCLREQYRDQPIGEILLIGMDPIAGSHGGVSNLFSVEQDDDFCWLETFEDDSSREWYGDDLWVFISGT
ncbi:MAG: hypothetical protein KGI50_01495 [Patescibacteria group bacterium]|nr:hypothetical protein [Patescibacteria group bacterium]MDE2437980.1 hypothetical protein [Patescibacteria group bacterium]